MKIGVFSQLRLANSNNFEKWPTRVQKLDHPELDNTAIIRNLLIFILVQHKDQ